MIAGRDCGDLGYDMGYLRHGSFGRATREARQIAPRAASMRWRGLPRVLEPALAARCTGFLIADAAACPSPVEGADGDVLLAFRGSGYVA